MTKRDYLENIALDALRRTIAEHAIPNIGDLDNIDPDVIEDAAAEPDHKAFSITLTGDCFVEAHVIVGPKTNSRHRVIVNLMSFRVPGAEETMNPYSKFEHTIAA